MRRLLLGASAGACAATLFQRNFRCDAANNVPLSAGSSILVVGAGVVGVSTAYELANRGYKVRVLEQGPEICSAAFSASWGNAGTLGCSKQTQPLCSTLSKVFNGLAQTRSANQLQNGHGIFFQAATLTDPFFWLWGLTFLRAYAFDAHARFLQRRGLELAQLGQKATFDVARKEGLTTLADMRIEGRCSVKTAQPGSAWLSSTLSSTSAACSLNHPIHNHEPAVLLAANHLASLDFSGEDGQGCCASFSKGLAAVCERRHGTTFSAGIAVHALLLSDDGSSRVIGVRTHKGDEIRADAVVLCAGANVAPLAATAGLYVPVQPLRGYSLTAQVPGRTATSTLRTHIVFSPSSLYVTRLGSQIRFTCFGEMSPVRSDGPGPPTVALQSALRRLVELEVPNVAQLCDWVNAVEWVGSRPLTPDCYPLSGRTPVAGLFVNVGHSFNGWREATLSARVLADAVSGICVTEGRAGRVVGSVAPNVAVRAFDPARYRLW